MRRATPILAAVLAALALPAAAQTEWATPCSVAVAGFDMQDDKQVAMALMAATGAMADEDEKQRAGAPERVGRALERRPFPARGQGRGRVPRPGPAEHRERVRDGL
jgi:hypothetical protein